LRDPDDERILNKRDFAGADRFGIPILTPGEFIRDLRTRQ